VKALGFYNYGEWKAMCPEYGCTDAVAVYPQSPHPPFGRSATPVLRQVCARGHAMEIELPDETFRAQIETVLGERALDQDRSWYPKGHEWAVLHDFPTGQSVKDLVEEGRMVEAVRGGERAAHANQVREALAAAGIQVRPDGSFEGRI
jgi:hypothetical protein